MKKKLGTQSFTNAVSTFERCRGGCAVLCNYLDGAVADFENGEVGNYTIIDESIEALKVLGDFGWMEYEERMKKAKEKLGIKEED